MKAMSVKGREREKVLAKLVAGRVQPGSGSIRSRRLKGDVVTDDILWDNKLTGKASYGLTLNTLATLEKQALAMSKIPALSVEFDQTDKQYVVMRMSDFLEYRRVYEDAFVKGK